MSDALTENDECLDGILYDVSNSSGLSPSSALPSGLVGLQFKTTRRKQPTALKLSEELRKTGPRRVLISGGTYVLAWSQDLNYPQREAAAQALRAEAETVLAEAGLPRRGAEDGGLGRADAKQPKRHDTSCRRRHRARGLRRGVNAARTTCHATSSLRRRCSSRASARMAASSSSQMSSSVSRA